MGLVILLVSFVAEFCHLFSTSGVFYSKETGTRWKFKTNKPKELLVGNPVYDDNPYRTCISKNILEKKIINIFNEI